MKGTLARAEVFAAGPQRRWLRASEARVEGQVIQVTAGTRGRVDRVLVGDNQPVEKGQPLVTLESPDLDRQLEKAAAGLARAAAATARGASRSDSSRAVAEARKRYVLARLERFSAEIQSPAKGRVLSTAVAPGDFVHAGQPLISILGSDDLWVMACFEPRDFARLRMGQQARVGVGMCYFDATVSGFATADDPVLLEFTTRPHPELRPGMAVKATVRANAADRIWPALVR